MNPEGTIFVVYATDEQGLVPLPEDFPNDHLPQCAFPSRRAANAAARRLVGDGAIGAVVVRDATIVGHFGKRPKFKRPKFKGIEKGGEAEG